MITKIQRSAQFASTFIDQGDGTFSGESTISDFGIKNQRKMSLKPKEMNFEETWGQLRTTVEGVVTLGNVPRNIWNDRFS